MIREQLCLICSTHLKLKALKRAIHISWTKTEKSQDDIRNSPTDLPTIPPELSLQPEYNTSKSHLAICWDKQVLQEARDKLLSLL